MGSRDHWESVYRSKPPEDLSWYQRESKTSLSIIRRVASARSTAIIDVGGGASKLVDGLLDSRYGNVTVLDLSATALSASRHRLGERATAVNWIEADVLSARLPADSFDVWHDRAAFHFLMADDERARYVEQASRSIKP